MSNRTLPDPCRPPSAEELEALRQHPEKMVRLLRNDVTLRAALGDAVEARNAAEAAGDKYAELVGLFATLNAVIAYLDADWRHRQCAPSPALYMNEKHKNAVAGIKHGPTADWLQSRTHCGNTDADETVLIKVHALTMVWNYTTGEAPMTSGQPRRKTLEDLASLGLTHVRVKGTKGGKEITVQLLKRWHRWMNALRAQHNDISEDRQGDLKLYADLQKEIEGMRQKGKGDEVAGKLIKLLGKRVCSSSS